MEKIKNPFSHIILIIDSNAAIIQKTQKHKNTKRNMIKEKTQRITEKQKIYKHLYKCL